MRRWVGVLFAGVILACAAALPSGATHQQILLRVDGESRIVIPFVENADNDQYAVHFSFAPAPDTSDSDSLDVCWNGHFDRDQLTSGKPGYELCSSRRDNGSMRASTDGATGTFNPLAAGRYEAFVSRASNCFTCYPPPPTDWNASNVVGFDVVDPCRLRFEKFTGKVESTMPLLARAPMPCSTFGRGELRANGEDGSSIALDSQVVSIQYDDYDLPWAPMLQFGTRGANADIKFSLKNHLASLFTIVHSGGVMLFAVSPASATIVHRRNVSRVKVQSGRVVALGMRSDFLTRGELVPYCGRKRPTIACLSKIRYRYFTMKRGTSLRARVLRAGQKATFRKAGSVARILRP